MRIIVAILALLIIGCVPKEKDADPVLFKIEHSDRTHTYIHESGRITDVYGNVKGYIE